MDELKVCSLRKVFIFFFYNVHQMFHVSLCTSFITTQLWSPHCLHDLAASLWLLCIYVIFQYTYSLGSPDRSQNTGSWVSEFCSLYPGEYLAWALLHNGQWCADSTVILNLHCVNNQEPGDADVTAALREFRVWLRNRQGPYPGATWALSMYFFIASS